MHLRRYRGGTRNLRLLLESVGHDHLSHRLQQAGLRPRQVVWPVYLMASLLAVAGVVVARYRGGALVLAVEIALIGLIVGERPFGSFISGLSRRRREAPQVQALATVHPGPAARDQAQPASYAAQEGSK